jgi:hypothetical protein
MKPFSDAPATAEAMEQRVTLARLQDQLAFVAGPGP